MPRVLRRRGSAAAAPSEFAADPPLSGPYADVAISSETGYGDDGVDGYGNESVAGYGNEDSDSDGYSDDYARGRVDIQEVKSAVVDQSYSNCLASPVRDEPTVRLRFVSNFTWVDPRNLCTGTYTGTVNEDNAPQGMGNMTYDGDVRLPVARGEWEDGKLKADDASPDAALSAGAGSAAGTKKRKRASTSTTPRKKSPREKKPKKKTKKELLKEETKKKREEKWLEMYDELKQYRTEGGGGWERIPVDKKELKLWVKNQRRQRREGHVQMSEERAQLLDEIRFNWEGRSEVGIELEWHDAFERLRRWKEHHGHIRIRTGCWKKREGDVAEDDEEEEFLGRWINLQRIKAMGQNGAKLLDEERIRMLADIGLDITNPEGAMRPEQRAERWASRVAALQAFYEEHGHWRVPRKYHDTKLADWVMNVRKEHQILHGDNNYSKKVKKAYNFKQEEFDELEAMGFDFTIVENRRRKTWEDRFAQLAEFQEAHQHCRVPCKYAKVLLLPRWTKEQRLANRERQEGRESKMTWERFVKLDRLGFEWVVDADDEERCSAPWTFCTCDMDIMQGTCMLPPPEEAEEASHFVGTNHFS